MFYEYCTGDCQKGEYGMPLNADFSVFVYERKKNVCQFTIQRISKQNTHSRFFFCSFSTSAFLANGIPIHRCGEMMRSAYHWQHITNI